MSVIQVDYRAYLESPEWRTRRAAALDRAGHRCEFGFCRSPELLEVHHKTYERLGCELPEDLEVLCGTFHALTHDKPVRGHRGDRFRKERDWRRDADDPTEDYRLSACSVCGTDTRLRCGCGDVVCHWCDCSCENGARDRSWP